jgi:cytochrome c5
MMHDRDRVFFRNYSIVLGLLGLLIIIFFFLARAVGMDDTTVAQRGDKVAETTRPVGEVRMPGDEPPAAEPAPAAETAAAAGAEAGAAEAEGGEEVAAADMGKQVYSGLCFSCHGTGLPGIPQLGDKGAWAPRIAQGKEVLYKHAIEGFTGESGIMMPPKGGNPALTDEQVKAAVDYIVEQGS